MSLTYLEELIEAVSYAQDDGTNWWDVFDSIDDADDVVTKAGKEEPDEYQVAHLMSILEDGDIFIETPLEEFKRCIKKLKRELKKIRYTDRT